MPPSDSPLGSSSIIQYTETTFDNHRQDTPSQSVRAPNPTPDNASIDDFRNSEECNDVDDDGDADGEGGDRSKEQKGQRRMVEMTLKDRKAGTTREPHDASLAESSGEVESHDGEVVGESDDVNSAPNGIKEQVVPSAKPQDLDLTAHERRKNKQMPRYGHGKLPTGGRSIDDNYGEVMESEDDADDESGNQHSAGVLARSPVGEAARSVATDNIEDLFGDNVGDDSEAHSIHLDETAKRGAIASETSESVDTSDMGDLFGVKIGVDAESTLDHPGPPVVMTAELAFEAHEMHTAPTLANLREELEKVVVKKAGAFRIEGRVLEKRRKELVRQITSMERKLSRERDDAMKVNKSARFPAPPQDGPDPWDQPAQRPRGRIAPKSQKRKREESIEDRRLDTEVSPKLRKRSGRKPNKIEQAMEQAGLYPEDPDREAREKERKAEKAKEKAKEKAERGWEGAKARKKEKQSKEKGQSLWNKWKSRMPWETGRWSTEYEKSG